MPSDQPDQPRIESAREFLVPGKADGSNPLFDPSRCPDGRLEGLGPVKAIDSKSLIAPHARTERCLWTHRGLVSSGGRVPVGRLGSRRVSIYKMSALGLAGKSPGVLFVKIFSGF